MKVLLRVLTLVAAVGAAASLVLHVAALAGVNPTWGMPFAFVLFGVVFVVWPFCIFVSQRLARDVPRAQVWTAIFRNGPPWFKPAVSIAGGYALACLAVLGLAGKLEDPERLGQLRVMSAYAFAFHFAAAATLYCGSITPFERRRCSSGHAVSPFAKFCEVCGESLPAAPPPRG